MADKHFATSSFLLDNPQSIHQKLTDAFASIKVDDFHGLIQFWAAENIDGRWLLTTSDQPFIVSEDYEDYQKHRSCCEKYKYNIDKVQVDVEKEDPTIISTGAPATAFHNQLPEFPKFPAHMIVEEMSPMNSSALQYELESSFVVPVFYPSLSCCVGVVEYWCWWPPKLVKLFNELNTALEKVGCKTFDARERLPCITIRGLQHAKDEIDDTITIISEVLPLKLTQVWIGYEDEYQVAFSSSLQDTRTKRMLWLKLTSHYIPLDEEHSEWNKNMEVYEEACYRLPLKMEQVFAGKTLENYEPLFIPDTFKLNGDEPQRLFSVKCSCFMICLRSTKTGELYVFEFIWKQIQHNDNIFETLLSTLKSYLPSFKLASGAELGDELRILDVEASTETETKYINIFQTNQLSPVSVTPKRGRRPEDEECLTAKCKTTPITISPLSQALKRGRQPKDKTAKKKISPEQIKSQFGETQKKAAQNLNVSLSTFKRKCRAAGIHEWPGKGYSKKNVDNNTESSSNEEEDHNGGAIQDNIRETSLNEDILTIKAEYAGDTIKFSLPISSATFAAVEKEISEELKLNPSDYKVKYRDEAGDWILLSSDKAMRECLRNHRNFNITPINMKVLLRSI